MHSVGKNAKRDLKLEYRTKSRAYKTRLLNQLSKMVDPGEVIVFSRKDYFSDMWNWD